MRRSPLAFWDDCVRRYGRFVFVPFGPADVVVLSEPDMIERVLVDDTASYRKHIGTRILSEVVGHGLLTSEGSAWLRQRRLAQPAFHKKRIDGYAGVMVDYTTRTLATWRDAETIELHAAMSRLTLEIVGKTLFDADVRPQARAVGEALDTVLTTFERRLASGIHIPFSWPTPENVRFRRAARVLDDLIEGILAERRAQPGDRGDLLSMLTAARDEAGVGMSQKQLRDEVMTLVLAGHETTANTMVWTFQALAGEPAAEARLAEELARVLGPPSSARAPTLDDLAALPYTANVVRESMRLYPAAWGVGREATREAVVGPWRIAAGTTVLILQWAAHRDARHFARPLAFAPERWEGDFAKSLPRFAYFPFGGGPRQCIGNAFATMEATLLLATIASRWRLRATGAPVEPVAAATLRPKGPVRMRIERR